MPPRDVVEARPRTTAELLDDAWRIYRADVPLLLALSGVVFLPAAACLVALVFYPAGELLSVLLVLLTSLLLPATGLAAGACQEAYHSWAESYPITFRECYQAACRRGLHHAAAQALTLLPPLLVLVGLVSPVLPAGFRVALAGVGLVLWLPLTMIGLSRHASLTAGQKRFWRAVKHSLRATGQHTGRALLFVGLRGVLLAFAVLNLHLFLNFGLWAAESLGGFDVAFVNVLCSLGNMAYLFTLTLAAAWLLMPWTQAVDYLFFVDARTRYEGLDLWQRVEELFPVERQSKVGALLAAVALGLLGAGSAAAEEPLTAVRGARQEIGVVRQEVKAAQPYPGGKRWVGRLQAVGTRLEKSSPKPGGFRWFQEAVADFANHGQARALEVLDDLDARLALLEDSWARPKTAAQAPSKDALKALVPPEKEGSEKKRHKAEEVDNKAKEPPPDDQKANEGGGGGGFGGAPVGPGVVGPVGLGGAAYAILLVLVGLAAAALLVGIALAIIKWYHARKKAAPRQQGRLASEPADHLADPDKQDPAELWRQSDELARRGDFLRAVRALYLAVLALLHQGGFIRYERNRTNGEYVDQLRPQAGLQRPFLRLTGVFEVKWYGERDCAAEDYQTCRELAGEIRAAPPR
jgi:hypothetical protein